MREERAGKWAKDSRDARLRSYSEELPIAVKDDARWTAPKSCWPLKTTLLGLEDNSIELRMEMPESDGYVGNLEDYVDAAGCKVLLQNLAESDRARRGAPPAARSAVRLWKWWKSCRRRKVWCVRSKV
ncbi:hypothetical protein NE237_015618 [Protea cynaroides]|uniref:Uncharacterized protein n=1 Tax=Protea cynaroides TaxID=273540 RepID=A0A9Q0KEC8_9MAGN|nr:hypothetical protein NE237_015618 [Protea cynaroides]